MSIPINITIESLKNDVENYVKDRVDTSIIDFSIEPPGGQKLNNGGEIFKYKVRVINQGELNMRNVRVLVKGTPRYADVSQWNGPYSSSALSSPFNLDAHQTYTTSYFYGRTTSNITNGPEVIVIARIDSWDANLDHILITHSNVGPNEGELKQEITQQ